jgi:hypothetical protein
MAPLLFFVHVSRTSGLFPRALLWHEKTFLRERENARKNFSRLFSTRKLFAKMRAFSEKIP